MTQQYDTPSDMDRSQLLRWRIPIKGSEFTETLDNFSYQNIGRGRLQMILASIDVIFGRTKRPLCHTDWIDGMCGRGYKLLDSESNVNILSMCVVADELIDCIKFTNSDVNHVRRAHKQTVLNRTNRSTVDEAFVVWTDLNGFR